MKDKITIFCVYLLIAAASLYLEYRLNAIIRDITKFLGL